MADPTPAPATAPAAATGGAANDAVFGPHRHMDEIDAAREAFAWLEATALRLSRIPDEQIKIEREDCGVRVYWRKNRPHAVMLTIRDGLNFTFGMGFDLSRLAAPTSPPSLGAALPTVEEMAEALYETDTNRPRPNVSWLRLVELAATVERGTGPRDIALGFATPYRASAAAILARLAQPGAGVDNPIPATVTHALRRSGQTSASDIKLSGGWELRLQWQDGLDYIVGADGRVKAVLPPTVLPDIVAAVAAATPKDDRCSAPAAGTGATSSGAPTAIPRRPAVGDGPQLHAGEVDARSQRTRAHLPPLGHDADDESGWSKISQVAREASGLDQDALADIYNDWIGGLPEDQSNPHQFKSFLAGVALVQSRAGAEVGIARADGGAVREAALRRINVRLRRRNARRRERVEHLVSELALAEQDADEARGKLEDLEHAPWPKWADECLKIIRKHSGYDGYDDASDGIDLPTELEETLYEYRHQARRKAVEARVQFETRRQRDAAEHHKGVAARLQAELDALAAPGAEEPAGDGWRDESTAPQGKMLVTFRLGEEDVARAALRVWPDGDREWIAPDGRTTVTHHSYAPPTHWLCEAPELPAPPAAQSREDRT